MSIQFIKKSAKAGVDINDYFNTRPVDGDTYESILKKYPIIDLQNITTLNSLFKGNTKITEVQFKNANRTIIGDYGFQNCTALEKVEGISSIHNGNSMFENCTNLKSFSVKEIDNTNSGVYLSLSKMFKNCTNLENIPKFKFLDEPPYITNSRMVDMIFNCPMLSDESLNNILYILSITSYSNSNNRTLKYIGFSEEQANRAINLSYYQAALNNGWSTGYETTTTNTEEE